MKASSTPPASNFSGDRALLPAGLEDLLPPKAAHEAAVVERLISEFARHGYERVKPPLIEFEDTLLSGPGAELAQQTFRLMDPVSQRMMGVRADMTLQVARIALTRLLNAPRPLRLSYSGQVLRVKGTQLRPERQFGQVGAELIGALQPTSDAELVLMAASSLLTVGVKNLTVDLSVPTLVPTVCRALGLPALQSRRVRAALDRRDAAALASLEEPSAALLARILAASGPAKAAVEALRAIGLPAAAEPDLRRLAQVVEIVSAAMPDLHLTVDPVEQRGFEYQTGLSFTFLSKGVRGELGRGGRYRAGGGLDTGEPATGFTLYTDTVLRAVPPAEVAPRLFLQAGISHADAAQFREAGWHTVAALETVADTAAEAKRFGCTHHLVNGKPVAV